MRKLTKKIFVVVSGAEKNVNKSEMMHLIHTPNLIKPLYRKVEKYRERQTDRQTDRQTGGSNSNTFFPLSYKDCSLGSVKTS